jgi:cellulose synthase/poly-beta-1,6-N-acetylglucosamine synthase-like glycosyltransferase
MAAVDRAMGYVQSPISVFTDANTMLNQAAIKKIVRHFADPEVGGVAGEKRVCSADGASARGESLYWRYESFLKRKDAEWGTVVGAAGELFAVRTDLFNSLPAHTILDDFVQTLLVVKSGYRVAYEPAAYAMESASLNLREEWKRKVRICAGGFQSIGMLGDLANPFRYGRVSFQYLSHRVLRWTLAPAVLPLLLLSNILLALSGDTFMQAILLLQVLFYLQAAQGFALAGKKVRIPGFFVPAYFLMMNWAAYRGFFRYLGKTQSAVWEKASRRSLLPTGD